MIHRVVSRRYRAGWVVLPILFGLVLQAMAPLPGARRWSEAYVARWAATERWRGLTVDEGVLVCQRPTADVSRYYHPGPIQNVRHVAPRVQLPRSAFGDARWSPLTDQIVGPDGRPWAPFVIPSLWYFTGTTRVVSGGSTTAFQSACNAAVDGDIVQLASTVTYSGTPYDFPARGTAGYVLVTTQGFAVAQGTRVVAADFTGLPEIAVNASQIQLMMAQGASGWYFRGVSVQNRFVSSTFPQYGLLSWRNTNQSTDAHQATKLILEQCWLNGNWDTSQTRECVRGIRMDGEYQRVLQSRIEGFAGGGLETQAICGISGRGKALIDDCYLEGSTENFIWGGGGTGMPAGEYNADIVVRRSHLFKRVAWMNVSGSTVATRKNFYEIKNAYRHVLEGCECENHDGQGQQHDLVFNAKPQTTAEQSYVRCRDIWVRHGRFRASYGPLNVGAAPTDASLRSNPGAERIQVSNSLWQDSRSTGTENRVQIVGLGGAAACCPNVAVEWNTLACRNTMLTLSATTAGSVPGLVYCNNVGYGLVQYIDPFASGGMNGSTLLDSAAGAGQWTCAGNVKYATNSGAGWGGTLATTNYRAASPILFVDQPNGDYTLADSRYTNKATDGGPPGCDFATLLTFTAGVR